MTIALWCILIAGLLPYLATVIAKGGRRDFDNADPRAWLSSQEGFRKRANAAQLNGFETFPLFAAAVFIAHMLNGPQRIADLLAMGFVLARILHLMFYLANRPALRSLVWGLGLACVIGLFVVAAQ